MPAVEDVVGVFDGSGNELFVGARALRAIVNPSAKLPKHPLESGASTTDHIIFDPITIELSVILNPADFQGTYQQIKNAFLAKGTVTVLTKTDSYPDMMIQGYPHDEDPELFDTAALALKLEQVVFVKAQYAQLPASMVKKKANASTVKTGQKNPEKPKAAQSSAAYDLIFGSKP